jgi:oxidase EvaA
MLTSKGEVVGTPQRAKSMQELYGFLAESKIGFLVAPIRLREMASWHFSDGALSHRSGGFFSVAGVQLEGEQIRQAIFLYQPQSAITGLLTSLIGGERHFLLQARAEPGNIAHAQFGPTVQSTPANYLRAHGGKASPYIELFTTHQSQIQVLHDSMQLDYGERYLFKSKRLIVAQCDPDIPVEAGFVWVPVHLISELVAQSNFSTFDLRSLLAMCDWFGPQEDTLWPMTLAVRLGLQQPIRSDVMGDVFNLLQGNICKYRFCDISAMTNWLVSDTGLVEHQALQGIEVGYYHVEVRGREVAQWNQPLVSSKTDGHASLLCRMVDESLEVLVRVQAETGLQTGKALLPSYLRYPGTTADSPPPQGKILLQTTESDEGGRFFCDTSHYELIMDSYGADSNGVWLRISELKFLLSKSNICSIQLRCLASMLLGSLHMDTTPTIE